MHLIKHKRRLFNLVLHAHFIDILLFMLAKTHRTVTYAGGVNCSVIKGIVFRFEASFCEVLKTDIIFRLTKFFQNFMIVQKAHGITCYFHVFIFITKSPFAYSRIFYVSE